MFKLPHYHSIILHGSRWPLCIKTSKRKTGARL